MNDINKIGRNIALISFILGTILFAVFTLTLSDTWALFSFFLVLIMIIINLSFLILLLYKLFVRKDGRKKIVITILIIFLNIPIAKIYEIGFLILLNTIQLTIINKSQETIENIKIQGCDEKYIKQLEPNEGKTVWIFIPYDCSIDATFNIHEKRMKVVIMGYVTTMMGERVLYEIKNNS
ncbi:hypothetical protein ETU10_08060 [Apibacter muscae]|uniref:hypothetical protein n=1 Tax=Apibacter muscae TaxID=2509004 RepID=UPI0011ACE2D3|nr:hypothetical protein [Apibacter muscae]TWP23295.1 hypothetical protein ETU10_08060 [Apibacter muscae]